MLHLQGFLGVTPKEEKETEAMNHEDRLQPPNHRTLVEDACPSTATITAYVQHELDEETSKHVRVHVLHCKHCAEEVLLLERLV